MTKSRRPDSARNQKAPEAHKPKAPFVRPPKSAKANLSASSKTFQPQTSTTSPAPLGARITRRAADRLRSGHLWVYASDIESLSSGSGDPPNLLPVADNRGLLLGTALYSPSSQIALRLIAREAVDEPGWLALLESRLERSIERRIPQLKVEDAGIDSCRLCFRDVDEVAGEALDDDEWPILVDDEARNLVGFAEAEAAGIDAGVFNFQLRNSPFD